MGWLSGWSYRKSHVINYAAGAGALYQKQITVHYSGTGGSGEDVYLNEHCRTDFGDVRFTDDDGSNELDYWMESKVNSDNAVFWVEVADDLSTTNQTIFCYYGKADATTTSNGANTFLIFDDFSGADNWLNLGGATHSVSGGQMSVADSGSEGIVYRNVNLANGYAWRFKLVSKSTIYFSAVIDNNGANVVSGYLLDLSDGKVPFYKAVAGAWSFLEQDLYTTISPPFIAEVRQYGGNTVKFLVNDVEKGSLTDTTFTTGRIGFRQVASRNKIVDDVSVRKFVSPEPSHGDWGSEEQTYGNKSKTITESLGGLDSYSRTKSIFRITTESLGLKDVSSYIATHIAKIVGGLKRLPLIFDKFLGWMKQPQTDNPRIRGDIQTRFEETKKIFANIRTIFQETIQTSARIAKVFEETISIIASIKNDFQETIQTKGSIIKFFKVEETRIIASIKKKFEETVTIIKGIVVPIEKKLEELKNKIEEITAEDLEEMSEEELREELRHRQEEEDE